MVYRSGADELAVAPALPDLAVVLPYWSTLPAQEYLLDGIELLIDGARARLR